MLLRYSDRRASTLSPHDRGWTIVFWVIRFVSPMSDLRPLMLQDRRQSGPRERFHLSNRVISRRSR